MARELVVPEAPWFFARLLSLSLSSARPFLWPTQHRIQWTSEVLSRGIKWPGREAKYQFLLVPTLRKTGSVISLPHMSAVLKINILYRNVDKTCQTTQHNLETYKVNFKIDIDMGWEHRRSSNEDAVNVLVKTRRPNLFQRLGRAYVAS